MVRNRSRARVSRGTGQRRKWVWARATLTSAIPTADADFLDALANFEAEYDADPIGCTAMRIRGQIVFDQTCVFAARIMTQSTLPQLLAANHGPRADRYADWFAYQPLMVQTAAERTIVDIDVKSARKLEELGQSILFVVDNQSSGTLNVTYNLSIGLKLP